MGIEDENIGAQAAAGGAGVGDANGRVGSARGVSVGEVIDLQGVRTGGCRDSSRVSNT